MTYEFITTGDAVTFIAPNDKIALACTIMVGEGKAGCQRYEGREIVDLEAMTANVTDPTRAIESRLQTTLKKFIQENSSEMVKCFYSFAYGTIDGRAKYDAAIAELRDPNKLQEWKKVHEEANRTSLTTTVLSAWELGDAIKKQF